MDYNNTTYSNLSIKYDDWKEATAIVNLYIPPVLIIFGVIFNFCVIYVMKTAQFRTLSTSYFILAAAINDVISLCVSLIPHWLHVNFPETIVRGNYSYIMCRFFDFYGWGNCDFGIIIMAAMTADRSYSILYPFDSSRRRTPVLQIIFLAGVVIAKEFHFWFASDVVPFGRDERLCEVPLRKLGSTYRRFYEDVWPWLHITFLTLCFLVIFISNTIIIARINKTVQNKSVKTSLKNTRKSLSDIGKIRMIPRKSQLRQITIMLLASSCVQLILTFPFSIHIAIADKMADLTGDPRQQAINALVFSVTFYMLYSNKCLNFVIFSCSGSRFRHTWMNLLCPYSNSTFVSVFRLSTKTDRTTLATLSYPTIPSPKTEETRL